MILLACFLMVTGTFLIFREKRTAVLDPYTVVYISLVYYTFYVPLIMVVTGDSRLPFLESFLRVSVHDRNVVSSVVALGYFAFSLGYRSVPAIVWRVRVPLAKRPLFEKRNVQAAMRDGRESELLLTVMVITCGAILLCFFPSKIIQLTTSYAMKIETKYDSSVFSLLLLLFQAVLNVFFNQRILASSKFLLWLGLSQVSFIVLAFSIFSKDPLIFSGLSVMCGMYRLFPRHQLSVVVASIGGLFLVLLFLVPTFSSYRATGMVEFVNPAGSDPMLLYSDARGPYATLVLAAGREIYVAVNPLWETFVLWIPKWVWPDRPLDASEAFAVATMPGWRPGFGVGFSPFAEAVLRFGLLLSPLLLFLIGVFMAALEWLFSLAMHRGIWRAAFFTMQGYIAFSLLRTPFSGLITTMLQLWIPFLLLSTVIAVVFRIRLPRYPARSC